MSHVTCHKIFVVIAVCLFLTSLTAFLVSLTFLSEPVSRFPAFVVPIPGFVDFVLETLTFSSENDESFAYYIYYV